MREERDLFDYVVSSCSRDILASPLFRWHDGSLDKSLLSFFRRHHPVAATRFGFGNGSSTSVLPNVFVISFKDPFSVLLAVHREEAFWIPSKQRRANRRSDAEASEGVRNSGLGHAQWREHSSE